MGATTTIELREFDTGDFMAWTVTSQAYNQIHVRLEAADEADNTVYFDASKSNHDTSIQVLAQSSAEYMADGELVLTVEVDESWSLQSCVNAGPITTSTGDRVGYFYNIAIEDASDNDFNDALITITSWKSKG
jgi:hypothetical protein